MNVKLSNPQFSSAQLTKSLNAIIRRTKLCAMATVGPKGQSHINTVYFCYDKDLNIYFISDTHTIHAANIFARPTMALSIYDSRQSWGNSLRGLQLFGRCVVTDLEGARIGAALYERRFPAYGRYAKSLSDKQRAESSNRFFVFHTEKVKVFDEDNLGEETFVLANVLRAK